MKTDVVCNILCNTLLDKTYLNFWDRDLAQGEEWGLPECATVKECSPTEAKGQ